MKSLPLLALAVALFAAASPPSVRAASLAPRVFHARLVAQIGPHKSLAAATIAARSLGNALRAPENKGKADKYVLSVVRELIRTVPPPRMPKATALVIQHLLSHFFTNGRAFNLEDRTFDKALANALKALPPSGRTYATTNLLFQVIKSYALKRGSTPEQADAYLSTLLDKLFIPPEFLD